MNNKQLTKKLLEKLQNVLQETMEENDLLIKLELTNINTATPGEVSAWFHLYYTSEDEEGLYDYETDELIIINDMEE